MRLAIVYDYLNQYGGGERVLEEVLKIFPEADLYTLFYDEEKTFGKFKERQPKGVSFLNRPFIRRNHHFFIPLMPKAAEKLDLKNRYDTIFSIGASYAKGISYTTGRHVSYCFTPLRYAWEDDTHIRGRLGSFAHTILSPFSKPIAKYLREWDRDASERPEEMCAISRFIADKIKTCYNRTAPIIYPPVDTRLFKPKEETPRRSYYMAAGRLMHYKNFDTIVEAFNYLIMPLKIVGRGPELTRLKRINTSPNTEFITDFISDEEMRDLYRNAKAFIFPQVEDFGLVAAEAIACGTPVIAYKEGGATDIVVNGENGLIMDERTPEAIIDAINRLPRYKFDTKAIARSADKFSKDNFIKAISALVTPSHISPIANLVIFKLRANA